MKYSVCFPSSQSYSVRVAILLVENKYSCIWVFYKHTLWLTLDALKKIKFQSASSGLVQLWWFFRITPFWTMQSDFICLVYKVWYTYISDRHCCSSLLACLWSSAISLHHIPSVYASLSPFSSLPPPDLLPDFWCWAHSLSLKHVFCHSPPKCSLHKTKQNPMTQSQCKMLRNFTLDM